MQPIFYVTIVFNRAYTLAADSAAEAEIAAKALAIRDFPEGATVTTTLAGPPYGEEVKDAP